MFAVHVCFIQKAIVATSKWNSIILRRSLNFEINLTSSTRKKKRREFSFHGGENIHRNFGLCGYMLKRVKNWNSAYICPACANWYLLVLLVFTQQTNKVCWGSSKKNVNMYVSSIAFWKCANTAIPQHNSIQLFSHAGAYLDALLFRINNALPHKLCWHLFRNTIVGCSLFIVHCSLFIVQILSTRADTHISSVSVSRDTHSPPQLSQRKYRRQNARSWTFFNKDSFLFVQTYCITLKDFLLLRFYVPEIVQLTNWCSVMLGLELWN